MRFKIVWYRLMLMTPLLLTTRSHAQTVFDFGQVFVGSDSVAEVYFWPDTSVHSLQISVPDYGPFYQLEYESDTTGGWHLHFLHRFQPETAGVFSFVAASCLDPNGNPCWPPDGVALIVRGQGVVPESADKFDPQPSSFILSAYPNPFNATTTITYNFPVAGQTKIEVFDITGRQTAVLVDAMMSTGQHRVVFDAADLPSGVYFARLTAATQITTHKLLLLK